MILKKAILTFILISAMVIFMSNTYNNNSKENNRQKIENASRNRNCNLVKGVTSNPGNGTDSVLINNKITVTFNRKMNPSTIDNTSFTLKGIADVSGVVTYNGYIATFTPSTPLDPNQVYTAIMSKSARSEKDIPLTTDFTLTFTTENTSLEIAKL